MSYHFLFHLTQERAKPGSFFNLERHSDDSRLDCVENSWKWFFFNLIRYSFEIALNQFLFDSISISSVSILIKKYLLCVCVKIDCENFTLGF